MIAMHISEVFLPVVLPSGKPLENAQKLEPQALPIYP